ncbi:MAG: hypothetical protein ACRD3R_11480, partial [Terriglobales bacterium]
MISKCANPYCGTPFRYLREGKLFQLYTGPEAQSSTGPDQKSDRHMECFWLCGRCAATLRLEFEKKEGVVTVRMVSRASGDAYMPAGYHTEPLQPKEISLEKDDRNLLDVLKFELDFVESGGYGRSVHTPQKPTSIFQDSITCINFGDPKRTRPCEECLLMQFVPEEHRKDSVPCHHIPLNARGESVEDLDNQQKLEENLAAWLRAT